jgi:hypothetical protein
MFFKKPQITHSYSLRDRSGWLKSRISASLAQQCMDAGFGFFRDYRGEKDSVNKVAYEISNDGKFTQGDIVVYLWAGDILIPD